MKKILLWILGAIILTAGAGALYFYTAYPAVGPAPEIQVNDTPAQIARGKYLANHVALCVDCHSTRDWSTFSGPIAAGTEGQGGEKFGLGMGLPGTFYSKNITPHNLNNWTDGEIYRAITSGVNKDGSALFPVMPYPYYNKMAPRDVKAIIAYIRTLEPKANAPPPSDPNFPMNVIMRTMPEAYDSAAAARPSREDIRKYGKYLVTIGACSDCHTPKQKGQPIMEQYMAGGRAFQMPGGTVRSSNLTPHKKTGIGAWSKEQFVAIFKQYAVPADSLPDVSDRGYPTIMPWHMYASIKQKDLEAIYEYLQSLEPKENEVTRFMPKDEAQTKN